MVSGSACNKLITRLTSLNETSRQPMELRTESRIISKKLQILFCLNDEPNRVTPIGSFTKIIVALSYTKPIEDERSICREFQNFRVTQFNNFVDKKLICFLSEFLN